VLVLLLLYGVAIIGTAEDVERNTPYYIWKTLLIQLLFLDAAKVEGNSYEAVDIHKLLERECDEQFKPFIPLLNNILPLKIPETDMTRSLSNRQRSVHICNLILHLINKRSSNRPLALILDNVQFIDAESLAVVYSVARELSDRILLLLSTRSFPEPAPHSFKLAVALPNTTHIRLKPMHPLECLRIACNRIGAEIRTLPASLQEQLLKAEGNPFLAEQIALSCTAAGAITIDKEHGGTIVVTGDVAAVPISSVMQGMITTWMDRLPSTQQLVLQVGTLCSEDE